MFNMPYSNHWNEAQLTKEKTGNLYTYLDFFLFPFVTGLSVDLLFGGSRVGLGILTEPVVLVDGGKAGIGSGYLPVGSPSKKCCKKNIEKKVTCLSQ